MSLSLPGGSSRTLGAWELETGRGEGLGGSLGNGTGRWQLLVTANRSHSGNESARRPDRARSPICRPRRAARLQGGTGSPETAAGVFIQQISGPVVQSKCVNCHVAGGRAGNTRLVFRRSSTPGHLTANLQVFQGFLAAVRMAPGAC